MKVLEQAEVRRDRWGRPLIGGEPYTRATTLSGALEDKSGLIGWSRRSAVQSLLDDPSLLDLGSVDKVVKATEDRGAAAYGTSVHSAIESILLHGHPGVGGPAARDAQSAVDLLEELGLEALAPEVFVVNDEVRAAGTLDLLAQDEDGQVVIVDWKTTAKPTGWRYKHLSYAVQLAIYSRGLPINSEGFVVDWSALGLLAPIQDQGIVVQIHSKRARASAFAVDLEAGWELAALAYDVMGARRVTTLEEID